MPNLLSREDDVLRRARRDVETFGYITGLTAARLEAWGFDVARLEQNILDAVWR